MSDTFKNPFRGLYPYLETEEDARLFFGRDKRIKDIINRLKISRLTVLYGKSGVGKSSFLRAGVTYELRQQMDNDIEKYGIPRFAVVTFPPLKNSDSSEDSEQHQYICYDQPPSNFKKHIQTELKETVEKIFKKQNNEPDKIPWPDPNLSFVETLECWTELLGGTKEGEYAELFIILDQFEDYLLSYPLEDNSSQTEETFTREFCRAVNNRRLYINFLICIRDSSFLQLNRFKGRILDIMSRGWELEPLNWDSGKEVIEKTVEKYNELYGVNPPIICEDKLVEEVLNGIWNQSSLSEKKQKITDKSIGKRIEAPYLQIVMERLWDEEREKWRKQDQFDERYLCTNTLKRLGWVEGIIQKHIDQKMNSLEPWEQEIAARMFYYLVTPSGQRHAYSVQDLAFYIRKEKDKEKKNTEEDAESERKKLAMILETLAKWDNRILRTVKSPKKLDEQHYEVFYDVLAQPILQWSNNYWEQLTKSKEKLEKQKEDLEKQKEDLEKQIENDFLHYYTRAESLKNNKKYHEAIKHYNQARNIDPENYDCCYHLATSLKELGHQQKDGSDAQQKYYREAINSYDQAMKIRSDDYDCWYHRAISLKELGDQQKDESDSQQKYYLDAIECFEKALKKRPEDFSTYYNKARVEYKLGEYSKAMKSFERALDLNPHDRTIEDYLDKLRKELEDN